MQLVSTGIEGLDSVLSGGLIKGSTTVIKGSSGTGKTIFGLSLASSLSKQCIPCIYVSFDESIQSIKSQVTALSLAVENVSYLDMSFDPQTVVTSDNFELSAITTRIELEVNRTGAEVLIFDGFDVLVDFLGKGKNIRTEMHRIFRWCNDRNLTLLATFGIKKFENEGVQPEDYASDCIIQLSQEIQRRQMTRILRVVKCRKKPHGSNAYPYMISSDGIYLLPITSSKLDYNAQSLRVSTGVPGLDEILGGGIYRGNTTIISGKSGSGKSLLALSFVHHFLNRNEKVLFFSFEESPSEIHRNTQPLGFNFDGNLENLLIKSTRPVEMGLEQHLLTIMKTIEDEKPNLVIVDPVTSLIDVSEESDLKAMLMRTVTFLKQRGITTVFLELIKDRESDNLAISSLTDTWIALGVVEVDGEEIKTIRVKKSRGSKIDSHIYKLAISEKGVSINQRFFYSEVDNSRADSWEMV